MFAQFMFLTGLGYRSNSGNFPWSNQVSSYRRRIGVAKIMANDGSSRWLKWLVIFFIAAAAIGGGIWYFKSDHGDALQYQTAAVTRGDLTQIVSASGQLNPVVNVQVGSQISGNILKLYADYNSLVKSNQIVAQLDPATFQASVHQADGDLANANAALELAQITAKRSAELFKNNLIPQADDETAISNLHQAVALLETNSTTVAPDAKNQEPRVEWVQ